MFVKENPDREKKNAFKKSFITMYFSFELND